VKYLAEEERERIPLFSGPGHVFLLYCFIAFTLFGPYKGFKLMDYVLLLAGLMALGLPLGSLINSVYSAIWNLMGGYVRVGHSQKYYKEFKGKLDKDIILAIHDKILWEIATSQSIQYFRRRWAHYHFAAQIGIVSLFAIPIPFLIRYIFNLPTYILIFSYSYCLYVTALLLISILMFTTCSKLSKLNRFYIAQLFNGREDELRKRLQEEAEKIEKVKT
jgi:hypothetical protein